MSLINLVIFVQDSAIIMFSLYGSWEALVRDRLETREVSFLIRDTSIS